MSKYSFKNVYITLWCLCLGDILTDQQCVTVSRCNNRVLTEKRNHHACQKVCALCVVIVFPMAYFETDPTVLLLTGTLRDQLWIKFICRLKNKTVTQHVIVMTASTDPRERCFSHANVELPACVSFKLRDGGIHHSHHWQTHSLLRCECDSCTSLDWTQQRLQHTASLMSVPIS